MTKQNFNFDEIFSFAWSKTKQHAWFLVCSFMIYSVILSAVRLAPILDAITLLMIALSMLSMSLIIVRNESFSFADLFNKLKSPKLVINFIALTVIYSAIVSFFVVPFVAASTVAAGVLFLGREIPLKLMMILVTSGVMLIPGIYIAVRFKFYPYVLLENEHMNILDIIKQTRKITCCAFWPLFILFVTVSVFNILGLLAFGVGLIFTVPVSVFALAHAFRKLEGHTH